ncbi:MAG: ribosome biogenesis GTPase Der [Chitinophagales bacterium]
MGYTVAIVGRPNVGKSTLFNRLIGGRQAIIDNQSGVTRDRQYGVSNWNGKAFNVIDTGGFVDHSSDLFEKEIKKQVKIAITEASAILFVVDVSTGITDLDMQLADLLRRESKKVYLVVNKVDNTNRLYQASEFYSLGFEKLFTIASISGSGTGELLDALCEDIKPEEVVQEDQDDELPKIAIVGQPNVGKSSLLNAWVGKEQNIVTDIAGTTRDAINTHYKLYNKDLLLIDTAGIRKKSSVMEDLEFYSVIRAINSIDQADVCVLILDATLGIESQDLAIFRQAEKKKKGIVIAVNKWDLIEDKSQESVKAFQETLIEKFAPFRDLPIVFISALEKKRISKVLDIALEVAKNRRLRITTSALNKFLEKSMEKFSPPAVKGKYVKIKYVTQLPTHTPTFAFFCNHPKYIRLPYKNYLENQLRKSFSLTGVPIRMVFRDK